MALFSLTQSPKVIIDTMRSLEELYRSIDEEQGTLCDHPQEKKCLEEELDESLKLLDLCRAMRDTLATSKDQAQELLIHLTLRRKEENNTSIKKGKNIKNFIESQVKQYDDKSKSSCLIFTKLRDARKIAITLLQFIVSFMFSKKHKAKWCFVSKAMNKRRVACEKSVVEFSFISIFESCVNSCKGGGDDDWKMINKCQDELRMKVSCIEEFEIGIERLYKLLIQERVNLLNLMSQ
ncbi:hypothetical protein DsansV1_C10g0101271 [Dioscorea sansibarensis]